MSRKIGRWLLIAVPALFLLAFFVAADELLMSVSFLESDGSSSSAG